MAHPRQCEVCKLEASRDEAWRAYHQDVHELDRQRDVLDCNSTGAPRLFATYAVG